jgi:hypothetical protein
MEEKESYLDENERKESRQATAVCDMSPIRSINDFRICRCLIRRFYLSVLGCIRCFGFRLVPDVKAR